MSSLILYIMMLCSMLGYTGKGNELIGQVKWVKHFTPIICPEYDEVGISLGVIQNGSGSVSSRDVRLFVSNDVDKQLLKRATESGKLIKIEYDERRVAVCREDYEVTKVTLLESK